MLLCVHSVACCSRSWGNLGAATNWLPRCRRVAAGMTNTSWFLRLDFWDTSVTGIPPPPATWGPRHIGRSANSLALLWGENQVNPAMQRCDQSLASSEPDSSNKRLRETALHALKRWRESWPGRSMPRDRTKLSKLQPCKP